MTKVCEPISPLTVLSITDTLLSQEGEECESVWGMRAISSTTILGGISLYLSFLFRRVSTEAGTQLVKERLVQQKDILNLSNEQKDQILYP
jgi:hypothetical protein